MHRRLELASQAAQAVACAHGLSQPVVHGDLKSLNFLVSRGDKGGYVVKLADFGDACRLEALEDAVVSSQYLCSDLVVIQQ